MITTRTLLLATALVTLVAPPALGAVHRTNIPMSPDPHQYLSTTGPNPCWVQTSSGLPTMPADATSKACDRLVLRSFNRARAKEGLGPLRLPSNWYKLTPAEQIFTGIDIERVDRGLSPFVGLSKADTKAALAGAQADTDPTVTGSLRASTVQWTSVWAQDASPLMALYGWMYNDGWGGTSAATWNVTCTSARAVGCWGHRASILSDPHCNTCVAGAAFFALSGSASLGAYTELVTVPVNSPALTFTWAKNVKPYLPH